MQSEGFKRPLLDPEVKSIGVGCFSQGKIKCWVQLFGTEKAERPGKQADISKLTDIRAAGENYTFYLGKTALELEPGKSEKLTVYLKNSGFSKASAAVAPETFQWSSSNSSVVSVDENGTVTAKKGGEATITCTSRYGDRQSLRAKVKVQARPILLTSSTRCFRPPVIFSVLTLQSPREQLSLFLFPNQPSSMTNISIPHAFA